MLVLVYITCSNEKESEKIGSYLVENRLCSCANIIKEIDSIYWWDKELEKDKESLLICKTLEEKLDEVISKVKEIHSYDNPAILAIPIIKASNTYKKWVADEINK
ncbi:MAG: divalent-cation tolerance protein CutA [Methanobrevibacter sp.]|jgi:periplasmic divalent cation tolerance protein|nr:divalent-cation tolerance protein CutA [Methanobrevibacter sp.]